jgi:hypothetical protein
MHLYAQIQIMKNTTIDLSQKFGRLTVTGDAPRKNNKKMLYATCDCGKTGEYRSDHIRSGRTKSCGCLCVESSIDRFTTHGKTHTTEYNIWLSMKARCLNKNHDQYKDYGGRGITVCERWLISFENFFSDMGSRPGKKTLDRINNDSGYSPENCKWSTRREQWENSRPALTRKLSSPHDFC